MVEEVDRDSGPVMITRVKSQSCKAAYWNHFLHHVRMAKARLSMRT